LLYLVGSADIITCIVVVQFSSFLSQLKKLQAMVGVPTGATGIMQSVTARQAQTGTCIMVC